MSLINQMLKDLDARHDAEARGRLHREVRPLPVIASGGGLRLAGIALSVAAVIAVGAWGYLQFSGRPTLPVVPASPPASTVPPVAPAPAAVADPVPAPLLPPAPTMVENVVEMKMSSVLERLPVAEPAARRPAPSARGEAAVAKPTGIEPLSKPASGTVEKQPAAARSGREQAETEYRRAMTLVNSARVAEATDVLLEALRQDGGHSASRQLLARLLIEQRRLDEAYAILAEGLAMLPTQTGWAMMLARLQVERGDLQAAAQTLQGSQQYASGNADYLGFAAHVQLRLGQAKNAADLYQAAARAAPAEGRWWLGLGLALEADHRQAEAREMFLRARATGTLNADLAALVEQKLR